MIAFFTFIRTYITIKYCISNELFNKYINDLIIKFKDQYDNLSTHTHKGIEFLDKYGQFIKDRSNIEIEYASKLRRLVKNHQIKKKDDEENQ